MAEELLYTNPDYVEIIEPATNEIPPKLTQFVYMHAHEDVRNNGGNPDGMVLYVAEGTGPGLKGDIPFSIGRVFAIVHKQNDPGEYIGWNPIRGEHAHKEGFDAIFCLNGSVRIYLDAGTSHEEYFLSDEIKSGTIRGVLVRPNLWHTLWNFEPGTVLVVFSEIGFGKGENYIRNYTQYLEWISRLKD